MKAIYTYNLTQRRVTVTRDDGANISVELDLMSQEARDHAALVGVAQRLRNSANPRAEAARLMTSDSWVKGR